MKVTTNKTAELAGVFRGTVDRVLHRWPGVNGEVRRNVQEIVERLEGT